MRVPLVLVTGFLGAGKTTLVNRLLARRAARNAPGKLGVIVNELGEVGIDGALLGGEATRQIELPGGCVCCVLGDELDRTLIDLVDANPPYVIDARSGNAEGLTAIVLETTGVAEPLPIAWALRREPVASKVRLAAVVTLVDATNFRASLPVSAAVAAQVAYSDVLLVSKAELGDAAATIAAARELAPRALVRTGTTDEHAAWLEQTLADPSLEHAPSGPEHVHDEHCRHADSHAHGVDSLWLEIAGPLDLEELEDQLAELPANYVRIKGIASDGARWHAFHRVGLRVSSEPLAERPAGLTTGRLVALGTELSASELTSCLDAAMRVNMV